MKKTVLTTIVALFGVLSVFSQDEYIVIEKSKKPRKEKTIRFNNNIGEIKFTPTQLVVGEINFSYERRVSDKTSIELSAGPTISNISVGSRDFYYYQDPFYGGGYAYQTTGVGAFVELGYRFYPLDKTEALNRFYLSPVLKYRLKNFGVKDGAGILQDRIGKDEVVSFAFNVGYQLWMSEKFSMDFFTGLGIGYQKNKDYSIGTYYEPNIQDYVNYWNDISASYARYVFNFGFKVGIGHE